MTVTVDSKVRTLVELHADGGRVLPIGTRAVVIGFAGNRLVLEVHDQETDQRLSVEAEVWEVLRW